MEKKFKKVCNVYQTYNYDLFKFLPENRKISNCRNLIKSIKKIDMTKYVPVVVDKDFYIWEGQHRYVACKELGKPINFVIVEEEIDKNQVITSLNANVKPWRREMFIPYYAKTMPYGAYQKMMDIKEKYTFLNYTAIAIIYPKSQVTSKDIKEGKINLVEQNPKLYDIIDFLDSEQVKMYQYRIRKEFINAIRIVFDTYSDNEKRKLKSKIIAVGKLADTEQYLNAFDNIIRRKRK